MRRSFVSPHLSGEAELEVVLEEEGLGDPRRTTLAGADDDGEETGIMRRPLLDAPARWLSVEFFVLETQHST